MAASQSGFPVQSSIGVARPERTTGKHDEPGGACSLRLADHDLVMTIFLDGAARKIYTNITFARLRGVFRRRSADGARGRLPRAGLVTLHSGDPGLRLGGTTVLPPRVG